MLITLLTIMIAVLGYLVKRRRAHERAHDEEIKRRVRERLESIYNS